MALGLEAWPWPDGGYGKAGQWNDVDITNGLYSLIEADELLGTSGKDKISGTNKGDVFFGGGGNDILKGLGGMDRIQGGQGADSLFGGTGADYFVYKFANESTSTFSDVIRDFSQSEHDKIDLSSVIKGQLEFIGTKGYSEHTAQVRYAIAQGETSVYVDTDGNGKSDMVVHLDGVLHLRASDFLL
jgi:Ca2+-binding RTX toxin-like protein